METIFRPASESDRPFLRWLETACMRDYAIALWGAFAPRELALRNTRVVVDNGEDVGCVVITRGADYLFVEKLYIAPRHQRRGLGAAVLRVVIAEAAASNLPVRLSVLTTNPAIAFYRREGLRVYRETPERIFLTT